MITETPKYRIALADDHILIRTGIASLVNSFDNCTVIIEASTGEELLSIIKSGKMPDVLLLDLHMPGMGGKETAIKLHRYFPDIHVLMLSMYDTEVSMIQLLHAGVKGFLKKDASPVELKFAINSVMHTGFYHSNSTTGRLVSLFRKSHQQDALMKVILSELEINFLRLTCTDHTYKGIAKEMGLNPRSVDNLRDSMFEKLDVKSRIGLAIYAIKHGIYSI